MIYIAIEHINGEIDRILNNLFTEEDAKELLKKGFILIEINLIKKEVKEYEN